MVADWLHQNEEHQDNLCSKTVCNKCMHTTPDRMWTTIAKLQYESLRFCSLAWYYQIQITS